MKIFVLVCTLFFSLSSSADYFNLNIKRKVGSDGKTYFCYNPEAIAEAGPLKCLSIVPKPNIKVENTDPQYRFTHLNVEEISLGEDGPKGRDLEVTLAWQGHGAGTLAIEGPKGTLIIFLQVQRTDSTYKVSIQNFFDQSLAEQFDRESVFGVSDNLKVEFLTANWLDEVLRPVLERYLVENAAKLGLSEKSLINVRP